MDGSSLRATLSLKKSGRMSVTIHYRCDGCFAEADGTEPLSKQFISVSGRSYGFGSWHYVNNPVIVAPDGWVAFDPHTQCCYCPKCWEEIVSGSNDGDEVK